MTKGNVEKFRRALDGFLEEYGATNGLQGKTGSIRYSDIGLKATIEATEGASSEDAEKTKFERDATRAGIKKEYGEEIVYGGRYFRLVGINLKARKYPYVGELNGKKYKLPSNCK